MPERRITICNELGLHARAAAKLVNVAKSFASTVHLERAEERIDAKSIMSVMLLAASQGTEITVCTAGEDDEAALAALCALIDDRFGEPS